MIEKLNNSQMEGVGMDERKVKGSVPNGYLNFIKRKWGISGLEEAMKYARISERPEDGQWYSMSKTDVILEWIARKKGMEYVKEAGRYAAKDLGIFRYLFASIIGLKALLKRSASNYHTLFNFGDMVFERTEGGYMITIKGARITEYSCPAWEGAIKGLMEISGSKGDLEPVDSSPEDCTFIIRT